MKIKEQRGSASECCVFLKKIINIDKKLWLFVLWYEYRTERKMTTQQIVSQIINFFGSTTNMVGICIKNKRKTLILFTIGNSLIAIALGLLGATAGMIVEICFVIESLINFFLEKKYTLYPIWLILVYVVVPVTILIIMFQSSWDLLPIVASVLFALSMVFHNFSLRLLNFLSVVLWIPYNIVYVQYVGAVSCGVLAIINLIAIIRYDILKKKESNREPVDNSQTNKICYSWWRIIYSSYLVRYRQGCRSHS